MSLSQRLTEFRFNLETLDLLTNMGKSNDTVVEMMNQLGFNQQLVTFMMSNRVLLNSVLLRLQLYSEQNLNEVKVRSSVAVLNNTYVNSLLDYLFDTKSDGTPVKKVVPQDKPLVIQLDQPKAVPPVKKVVSHDQPPAVQPQVDHVDEDEPEEDARLTAFSNFFTECVKVTGDSTDIIKMGQMYDTFNTWWTDHCEEEAPSKDELKEYLSEKLGRTIKSTITNVSFA